MNTDLINRLFLNKKINEEDKKLLEKSINTIKDLDDRIIKINKAYAHQKEIKSNNKRYEIIQYQKLIKEQIPQGYSEIVWIKIVNCYKKVLRKMRENNDQFELKLT